MCVPTESLARYTLGERIIPGRFTAPPKFVQSRRISKLMKIQEKLRYLEDRWDDQVARDLDPPELLRYRSNVLGSDLRITNFGGGNTSSKIEGIDPLDGSCQDCAVDQGQRRRYRQHPAKRVCHVVSNRSCKDWPIAIAALNSKTKWSRCTRYVHLATTRSRPRSTRLCMVFCPSSTSIICIRIGLSPWPLRRMATKKWKSSTGSMGIA